MSCGYSCSIPSSASARNGLESAKRKLFSSAVTCPAGTTSSQSPFGDPGCCSNGNIGFTANLDCTGTTNGSADVFLMVQDPTSSAVCTDYELSFHF